MFCIDVLASFALISSGFVNLIILFCAISMLYFMHIIWAASYILIFFGSLYYTICNASAGIPALVALVSVLE
jgi:hypothetical protein